jgi:hypothetical protein
MNKSFVLPTNADVVDLGKYLERAKRMDPLGAVRVRAYGDVLTVFVAPLFNADYQDKALLCLGLRTMQLVGQEEFDLTFSLANFLDKVTAVAKGEVDEERLSLADRLINIANKKPTSSNLVNLDLEVVEVSWATKTPARDGWLLGGEIPEPELTEAAKKGIAEVSETLPISVGGPIAARVRNEIWGRAFNYTSPMPLGATFVAAGLGFLTEAEVVPWYVSGEWVRLSSENGHVLTNFAHDYVAKS